MVLLYFQLWKSLLNIFYHILGQTFSFAAIIMNARAFDMASDFLIIKVELSRINH